MREAWGALRLELAGQGARAFPWLVVAFGAGIALFFTWRDDPTPTVSAGLCIAGLALMPMRRRLPWLTTLAAVVLAVGLGHAAAQWRTARVATPLLERESRPFTLTATVVSAEKRPGGNRIVVEDFLLPGIPRAETPRRLRITIPASHGLPAVGSRIAVRAVVRPASAPVMPDGFQFQRFLYFNKIGGVGYSMGRWQIADTSPPLDAGDRFRAWSESLRRSIGERIAAVVPGADGTVAAALVNGEQNAIPEDMQEAYRVAGIAHLLSISGVHMMLLAGVVFFAVRRALALVPAIALRIDTKKTAAAIGLAATAFYLLISGMSVPAVRSFLMIAVVMSAILLDRTALSLRTIAWAALVLMVLYPDAVIGASFQMSFLAVLALVALYEQSWLRVSLRNAEGEMRLVRMAGLYVVGLVVTDIVAGGTTSLLAAYHFNQLPTYSVVTNFVAVPLTGLWIMPTGVLALLLMPFGWDALPLQVMGAGVTLLNDLARAVAAWPGAQVHVPPMRAWAMGLGALGIVFVCLWRGRLRWFGLVLVVPATIQPFVSAKPDVLVDDTARVWAITDAQGALSFKPGRVGRFVRGAWAERYAGSDVAWPPLDAACDSEGCVLTRHGRKVLLAFTPTALAEDCGEVDLIISATASRDICRRGRVIDIFDLRRDGAVGVWLTRDGARTRSVRDSTGNRIWMRGVANDDPDAADIEP